jgi:DNA repair exonuclease SbcCD ATPase subunit
MGYKLAGDESILEALKSALESQKQIISQRELRERVIRELHKVEAGLTASGPRLRRLAITSGLAKVEIEWRETDKKTARARCPVCGSALRPTRNETVFGGSVTLGFSCPLCPFRSSMKRKEPTKYVFTRKAP